MNYLAIILSAVASMIIGSIWYGPLFGKKFMQLMEMDKWSPERQAEEKKKMGKLYAMQLVASLLMFYVLSVFIAKEATMGVGAGINVALLTWIGFVVPTQLGNAIWGGKMELFWLGAGNMLLTLLAAGAIIGAFA